MTQIRTSDIILPYKHGRKYVYSTLILRRLIDENDGHVSQLSFGRVVTNDRHTFEIYRYNALVKILGKTRRTIYHWKDRGFIPGPLNGFDFGYGKYRNAVLWIYRHQLILFVHLHNYLRLYRWPTLKNREFYFDLVCKMWRSCLFQADIDSLTKFIEEYADSYIKLKRIDPETLLRRR